MLNVAYTGVFDLFKVGIGPSSSHTVGPMVAARRFVDELAAQQNVTAIDRVRIELFGSLALTGRGHSTDRGVLLGLAGHQPDTVPIELVSGMLDEVSRRGMTTLAGIGEIRFDVERDFIFNPEFRPEHANVLEISVVGRRDDVLFSRAYASIGGGFVVGAGESTPEPEAIDVPLPFESAARLLELAVNRSIADVARQNELAFRSSSDLDEGLDHIASIMFDSIHRGLRGTGVLPGQLKVRRRARDLAIDLAEHSVRRSLPPSESTDWAGVWAIAVNEENAAGHRVVTAPTNGAAGIIPAVLKFLTEFCRPDVAQPLREYLLSAAAIGSLLKANAGISGSELGCQGEVGSACAMAAAGLAAALGGSPGQVENAAEIALEHNLGLTCDPVGGLVQIPCIERNAVGAVKAITAASLALRGDGSHVVSLDVAIETLKQTGADMDRRYKETSLAGLAVNVALPVSHPEC